MTRRATIVLGLVAAALAFLPDRAAARPVQMTASTPQAEAIIRGDHAEYVVRFDGPVNHYQSRMEIVQDGRVVQTMPPLQDSAVDVLFANGPVPPPGRYGLRWTAISGGGETSTGEIPFTVGQ